MVDVPIMTSPAPDRVSSADVHPVTTGLRGGTVTGNRLAGAAALIAVLTVLSRIVGFVRTLILGRVTGGNSHLTAAYLTANTIPNIIFEIVAGGALASLVVPLVAGAIARDDRRTVGETVSALLTWVLTILVPLAAVVAVLARPIVSLLIDAGQSTSATVEVATRMLRIFAIQIPLYGIGIVLSGLLQANRRFAWPVLAPLLSSVVVIATYVLYGLTEPHGRDIPEVSRDGRLILAIGTTLGVVALSLCLIVPARKLGLRFRPSYRFEPEARSAVGGLVAVGVITVAAQQLSLALAVALVNRGPDGSFYVFTLAQTVYLVPWAVLAVPVATSVYPALATAFATGDETAFQRTLAGSTRGVALLSAIGASALIAAATPIGRLLAVTSGIDAPRLATAIATFAPGLLGYGLFALHSRALYARRQNRYAAVATIVGWGGVVVASVVLALALPVPQRVTALTAANSIGMTVLAIVLIAMIRRRVGAAATAGVGRAVLAAVVAGAAGAAAGIAIRIPLPAASGAVGDIARGVLSGVVAVLVFVAVAALLDRPDVGPLAVRLRRLATRRRSPGREESANADGHNDGPDATVVREAERDG